jgi:hypothetical protein
MPYGRQQKSVQREAAFNNRNALINHDYGFLRGKV